MCLALPYQDLYGPVKKTRLWLKGAIESWIRSLEYAIKDAEAAGHPTSVAAEGAFGVILGAGYLGLARWIGGQESGKAQYEGAIAAFTSQLGAETKDEAQLGIGQLEKVKERYAGTRA